jgi:hypothetical protein
VLCRGKSSAPGNFQLPYDYDIPTASQASDQSFQESSNPGPNIFTFMEKGGKQKGNEPIDRKK